MNIYIFHRIHFLYNFMIFKRSKSYIGLLTRDSPLPL